MVFCTKCGASLDPATRFCTKCGTPYDSAPVQAAPPLTPMPPSPSLVSAPPAPWQNAVMLEQGERIVSSWRGDSETRDTVIERGRYNRKVKTTVKTKHGGVMILTTKRLVWLEERGLFGKSYHMQMNVLLESIKGLSMGGAILKYVSVADVEGESVFHLQGVSNDTQFNSFKQIIMSQVSARRQEIDTEKRKDRVHVMMDFSFLKSYMEKGGLAVTTIKCSNCAAPMKLPEMGDTVVCANCGQTNYVQDIFEKVKALIG